MNKNLDEMSVGLFFYFDDEFSFIGTNLDKADTYGAFKIYNESHFEAWDRLMSRAKVNGRYVDYDYYPRGRVVYNQKLEEFIIYYDRCIESQIEELSKQYEGFNYRTEIDEHYVCHNCNCSYVI